jgi:multiple antibiotic resistance protein
LVDLASYVTVALGTSGAKWMNLLAEKIMTRMMGLLPAALAVQFLFKWDEGRAGVTGTLVIVESDVFIRFNLRRQA